MKEIIMPKLIIIAAISDNDVIGKNGKVPWYIPEDLERFRKLTLNHPVIMGRRTYESILERIGKPLPERKNIVLTKRSTYHNPSVFTAHTLDEAISLCNGGDTYVIGGAEIYDQFLPMTNKMEITRVHKIIEGDTYFPKVDWKEWYRKNKDPREGYTFLAYERVGKRTA